MYKVGLLDGSFESQKSVSLGGENADCGPSLISWQRNIADCPVVVFTDMYLTTVLNAPNYFTRIAMLVEPRSMSQTHYERAEYLRDEFDCILTFDRDLTESETDYMFYPLGGSWIRSDDCTVRQKSKNVSIIASFKTGAVGHRLRHKIIDAFFDGKREHVYGNGYRYIESKADAFSNYRYSVVVESCLQRGYFSEKIVDCISMGTIPIYWGCSDIGDYFDKRGIITFNDLGELEHILNKVATEEEYNKRLPYIQKNYDISWSYRCSEDWIAKNYSFLFEQCQI